MVPLMTIIVPFLTHHTIFSIVVILTRWAINLYPMRQYLPFLFAPDPLLCRVASYADSQTESSERVMTGAVLYT